MGYACVIDIFVFYMKYSTNQRHISSFVVGRAESQYGLPMAVYMKYSLKIQKGNAT